MYGILNFMLIIAIIGGVVYVVKKLKENDVVSFDTDDFKIEDTLNVQEQIKHLAECFNDYFKVDISESSLDTKSREDFEKKREECRTDLEQCAFGDLKTKDRVKGYIKNFITTDPFFNITEKTIDNSLVCFDYKKFKKDHKAVQKNDKFLISVMMYYKKYGKEGFNRLLEDFNLGEKTHIREEDFDNVYMHVYEKLGKKELNYNDKLDILAQRYYELFKGKSYADMLYDMAIDDIEVGMSGISAENGRANEDNLPYSYESVWIIYKGRKMHLDCVSLMKQDELVRVCELVTKYNPQREYSRINGYVATSMMDGSRVVAVRPDMADSFAAIVRKFDTAKGKNLEDLIHLRKRTVAPVSDKEFNDELKKFMKKVDAEVEEEATNLEYYNKDLFIELLYWCIIGQLNCLITGDQGTGKSTFLKALVGFIPDWLSLRIQEKMFELSMRYAYPEKNILTFQVTDTVSAQEGLDIQKKTSGDVNIVGEIAENEQASHFIQTSMVASLFGLGTHHGKTALETVKALANNLLSLGVYNQLADAMGMVANVLNIDIHLVNIKGDRHPERITEIIPITDPNYPSDKDSEADMEDNTLEFYRRITDRDICSTKDIMKCEGNAFVVKNMPSERTRNLIRNKLSDEDERRFNLFLQKMQYAYEKQKK